MKFQSTTRRISRPAIPYDRAQLRAGMNAAQREMEKIAIELTSGTTSSAQLQQQGHPHSKRRPQNFPRLPINRQSGALQKALRIVRRVAGNTEQLFLRVSHPHAIVLRREGTSRMVPRGFFEEFNRRTKGILRNALRRAFRKK